ncbi:glycoside hydrolase family 43 protein [Pedobacter xixiisoli]|uniref:glycoside hydrolase family 43 protein n=1 Tax=Pedobacter xixiisoli TaxID=1476464 RepID=UPI00197DCEDF|nr:glycoside hydrolase family 43 protein [Pedobacter xixiisoli]
MKKTLAFLLLLSGLIFPVKVFSTDPTPIYLADPTMFYHEGVYYLYGTGDNKSNNEGFVVHTSKDLKTWSKAVGATNGYALKKGDAYGNAGFWAPQVFHYQNKFYMSYTADEHIAIATSDSPLGPFKQEQKQPIIPEHRNIDSYVFIDDDGKKYLYHVIVADGGNRIYVAEMEDDFSAIRKNTLTKCIAADTQWENTEKAEWTVTEGPTVVKKDGLYYMIYSANDFRSKDYAVGYAVSKRPLGPWKKDETNPILGRQHTKMNGSGHGDLFKDAKGIWYYVFHTHLSENKVGPRKTALLKVAMPSDSSQKVQFDASDFYYLQSNGIKK